MPILRHTSFTSVVTLCRRGRGVPLFSLGEVSCEDQNVRFALFMVLIFGRSVEFNLSEITFSRLSISIFHCSTFFILFIYMSRSFFIKYGPPKDNHVS